MWFVYILECSDGTLYTGITTDVNKRLLTHNKAKGAKYTKVRLPVVLRASKEAENRSLAIKEEYRIKQLTRKQKLELIMCINTPKNAVEIKSPNPTHIDSKYYNVFLAGSIEMGTAEDWQTKLVEAMSDRPIKFLNPRRDSWDSSWEQKITNPKFTEQVLWELTNLDAADAIVAYIDPNTKSPITLLEIGLHARGGKLIVLCPDGFWRKGNVDIVCKNYDIKQVETFDELIKAIDEKRKRK